MERYPVDSGVVIIGAGIAGLWTALELAPTPSLVITAGAIGAGSSSWAQGGLAAAMGADDSSGLHTQDTVAAGAGLTQHSIAEALCDAGAPAVEKLIAVGVPFDHGTDGSLLLGKEAAHQRNRIVHVGGDEAGAAIMGVLAEKAAASPFIDIRTRMVAERVVVEDGKVAGLIVWDIKRQRNIILEAATVVLATGGLGGLYAVTTNPLSSRGSGIALAAEAGADLRDLEFVQFHPTGLDIGRDPAPLATEAIRGKGGRLIDAHGERFMAAIHPDAELAPRDIVARGVAAAIKETGGAFLDVRGELGRTFTETFTTVDRAVRSAELNPETDLLPIAPAAHYHMGGVVTDGHGQATVPGLHAVGECASTGVHGANRLASNSLLEAIVFGSKAAEAIAGNMPKPVRLGTVDDGSLDHGPASFNAALRRLMADHAGLLRTQEGLSLLLQTIEEEAPRTVGDEHTLLSAKLVAKSALAREESRGAHQRLDFPDAQSPQHTIVRLNEEGVPQIRHQDVAP